MATYLLIASRDPFESNAVPQYYDLASGLAGEGNHVTLFLVHNGVLPARPCPISEALGKCAQDGVSVLADEFSLRERGIAADGLIEGVKQAPLDLVVDAMARGDKILWD